MKAAHVALASASGRKIRVAPSFLTHVRWCEHWAPLQSGVNEKGDYLDTSKKIPVGTAAGLRGRPAVSHISRKTSEMPRISCTQLCKTCAPFSKERRRNFRKPTKLRKSGMWAPGECGGDGARRHARLGRSGGTGRSRSSLPWQSASPGAQRQSSPDDRQFLQDRLS
jgi:hypothetical protein